MRRQGRSPIVLTRIPSRWPPRASARFNSAVVGVVAGAVAVFAACSEAPTQAADPPPDRPEVSIAPVMGADAHAEAHSEAQRLSAGVRVATARSLTAALAEFGLDPAPSMHLLQEFFDGLESPQVERPGTAEGPARTIDP
jgi:hypothetical protein